MTEARLAEKFAELLLLARSNQLPLDSLRAWMRNGPFCDAQQVWALAREVLERLSDAWPINRLLTELDLWGMQAGSIAYFAEEDAGFWLLRTQADADRLIDFAHAFHDRNLEAVRYVRQADRSIPPLCAEVSGLEECRLRIPPFEIGAIGIHEVTLQPGWDGLAFEPEITVADGLATWRSACCTLRALAMAWRQV